ncbi:MAG TPA: hypothetical protein PLV21_03585 [Cyclobacteriaceae bacterium]|nr:hypothetical protein [Cyclobacteriaceae bacterium]HRJ80940.1 hypothetical protein [Cyclobacteriaceae bacterium]
MQRFRKISAFALSLLVLFSSIGLTLSAHFCMGEIQDFALFSHASTCGMTAPVSPCNNPESSNSGNIADQGCCEDLTMIVDGQQVIKTETLSVQEINLITVFAWSYLISVNLPSAEVDSYKDYTPPLIERDIPVFVQSFLI